MAARHDFQAWIDRLDDELIGAAMTLVDLLPRATRALLAADHGIDIADHGVAFAQHATFAVTGTRVDVGRGAT